MKKYLKSDFYRLLTSESVWGAAVGVFFVYILGWFQVSYCPDVFGILYYIKMYSIFILIFAFGVSAFGNTLVEDAEHKYWYLMVQRGKIKPYIWSKMIACFCGAVLSITVGTMMFVLFARVRLPFLAEHNNIVDIIREHDSFKYFIVHQYILVYFFLTAVKMSFFGGILAIFSMLLSLYVKNRLFVICLPVVGFYFWNNYFYRLFGDNFYIDFNSIYLANGKIFDNSFGCFAYALGLAIALGGLMGMLIETKVEKEIRGEHR